RTASTDIYTLSLHDALPIYARVHVGATPAGRNRLAALRKLAQELEELVLLVPRQRFEVVENQQGVRRFEQVDDEAGALGLRVFGDRKSTRLNSSHDQISYAV